MVTKTSDYPGLFTSIGCSYATLIPVAVLSLLITIMMEPFVKEKLSLSSSVAETRYYQNFATEIGLLMLVIFPIIVLTMIFFAKRGILTVLEAFIALIANATAVYLIKKIAENTNNLKSPEDFLVSLTSIVIPCLSVVVFYAPRWLSRK